MLRRKRETRIEVILGFGVVSLHFWGWGGREGGGKGNVRLDDQDDEADVVEGADVD